MFSRIKKYWFLGFVFVFLQVSSIYAAEVVDDFSLLDHQGKFHNLYYYSDQKAIVLFVHGNGCPIVRKSISYLNDLKKAFEGRDVTFLMLNANSQDDHASIVQEAKEFGVHWPILDDSSQVVASALKIQRTAETLILDPETFTVVYHGPVHDQLGYETERPTVQHHYLKDKLNAFLEGKPSEDPVPPVKGCLIGFDEPKKYTYVDDVAPILMKKCYTCHSPGGVAPWDMKSYEQIRGWAPMIREVVRTKRMPPWFIDPHHGKFEGELYLTDEEIRTLVFWIEQGMPRGEGEDLLRQQTMPERGQWPLGEPDVVFQFDKPRLIPATGLVPIVPTYITPPVEKDLWIKAVHLLPGNFGVVHHANVIAIDPEVYVDKQANLMEVTEHPDWHKKSGNAVPAGQIIAGYVPGYDMYALPENSGMFVPKGIRLGFFMHYVTTGREETDLTKLGLYVHDEPPANIHSVIDVHNDHVKILPGEKEHLHSAEHVLEEDILLTALTTHMHYRGKHMKVTAEYPDGKKEILLSNPYYRFHWQKRYLLKEPKRLPAGTRILVEGAFDNSALNTTNPDPTQTVEYGPLSDNEMFNCFLYYSRPLK